MHIDYDIYAAQDTHVMYQYIMNSLTKTAIKKVSIWKDEYTINEYVLGNTLFKVLVWESRLDTKTTTIYFCQII